MGGRGDGLLFQMCFSLTLLLGNARSRNQECAHSPFPPCLAVLATLFPCLVNHLACPGERAGRVS